LKKVIEHKNFLCYLSETFLIVRRTDKGMSEAVYWSSYRVSVIHVKFQLNLNFLDRLSKITQISNFIKCVQWELTCSNGDRQAWWS